MSVHVDFKTVYRALPIAECGEPLAAVAGGHLVLGEPHPYVAAGAPYGDVSPWFLRQGVGEALARAGEALQAVRPGWKLYVFDALRPVAVQQFMVARELRLLAEAEGLAVEGLREADRARLMARVYSLWAAPSDDPASPPPHSTGAAVDVTLADREGRLVEMGGPIDEMGGAAMPEFYAAVATADARRWHAHRCLLRDLMAAEGFERHPEEWWHFSLGDQLWAYLGGLRGDVRVARYGRADVAG